VNERPEEISVRPGRHGLARQRAAAVENPLQIRCVAFGRCERDFALCQERGDFGPLADLARKIESGVHAVGRQQPEVGPSKRPARVGSGILVVIDVGLPLPDLERGPFDDEPGGSESSCVTDEVAEGVEGSARTGIDGKLNQPGDGLMIDRRVGIRGTDRAGLVDHLDQGLGVLLDSGFPDRIRFIVDDRHDAVGEESIRLVQHVILHDGAQWGRPPHLGDSRFGCLLHNAQNEQPGIRVRIPVE